MEILKLKIIAVLTEKISVEDFEYWLYNSEEFMSEISSDSFCFQVVSINYKHENWSQILFSLFKDNYDEDLVQIVAIERACLKILRAKTADETYKHVRPFLDKIDYHSEYNILLKFYDLDLDYNSFQKGMLNPTGFMTEVKFYSKQVVKRLNHCENLREKNDALKKSLTYSNSHNLREDLPLKRKLFGFLKKL